MINVRVESALQFYKLIKHKRGQDVTEIVKKKLVYTEIKRSDSRQVKLNKECARSVARRKIQFI